MPNWKKVFTSPMPPKWRYVLATALSLISAGAIAFTVRTITVPWQTIPLGCGFALISAAMRWIHEETVSTTIDVLVIEGLFALGLHFYPTAVRDTWPADAQLAAVLMLPTLVALPILEHFGVIPKVRREDPDEITTGAHKSLEANKSSPPVGIRRGKDQIVR